MLRILLVEDSEDDALLLLRELKRGGYETRHERVETREAMEKALANGGWDVIVSDFRMPRFDAPGALEVAKSMDSDAPFIVVSGKVGEEAAVEMMKAGATDYVMKGDLVRLCATVGRGLEEAEARRERRRIENELRESRERFELAVRGADDGIWDWDIEADTVYFSPRWKSILGYEEHEIEHRFEEWESRVHPEDRERAMEKIRDHLDGGTPYYEMEHRLLHKDGSWRWIRARGTSVRNGDGESIRLAGAHWDVTEHKRDEENLRRRAAILEAVRFAAERFLGHADGWELGIEDSLRRLGEAAEASRVYVFENFTGDDGEICATQRYEWVAEGVSAYIEDELLAALPYRDAGFGRWVETLGRGEPVYGHVREFPESERPELTREEILSIAIVPIFASGEWWGFVGFDECVAEREWPTAEMDALKAAANTLGAALQRQAMEAELREGEERYRSVIEQATDAIFLLDAETKHVFEANAAFEKIFGYSAEEIPFLTVYDLVAHTKEDIDATIRRTLAVGKRVVGERKYRKKDGSLVDVEVGVSVIVHRGRRLICTICRDVTERKKNEEKIRASEAELRALFEAMDDPIFVIDEEGRHVEVAPTNASTFYRPPDEIAGKTLHDIFPREKADEFLARVRRVLATRRRARFEYELPINGMRKWFEGAISPMLDDSVVWVARDITERKRAEKELEESRRTLLTLMSNLPGMAYRCRNDENWTMEFVSEGSMELTGFSPEDLVGNRRASYGDLIHADDRGMVWDEVQSALDGRRPFQFTYRIAGASGEVKWVWEQGQGIFDPGGHLLALEGFITDVTERKKNEEAVKESERLYRTVVAQATENIFLVDTGTGRIVESNPALRESLGYSKDELRYMKLFDIVAESRESVERNMRKTLAEGRAFVGERKYRRKDGSLLDMEVSGSVILRDGRDTLVAVAHDITERARAQRLLEERVSALSRISASLTLDLSAGTTLDTLAESVVAASSAVTCLVALFDEEAGTLQMENSHGMPEGYRDAINGIWREHGPNLDSPTMRAFRERRPALVRDMNDHLLSDPMYSPVHRFVRGAVWETVFIAPLVFRGKALGAINFGFPSDKEPGEDEQVFLTAVADQAAVVVENARLFTEARGKAALEERQRLSRELHDSVSQALYGIALGAKTARKLIEREPERAADPLDYVLSLTDAGLAEMRALIFELRPESLETEGLAAALGKQAAAIEARYGIEVRAELCEEPRASLEAKEAMYRIAQEALNNTVKHARASVVKIEMECEDDHVSVEISDDGVGFEADGDFPGHVGLHSMRERAARLGGTLEVESSPGMGTRVRASIPIG